MTIDKFNFAGKKAIVRVDFNVPLNEEGKITDDTRIRGALPTLKKILADGGALIIMSHMGKPKGKVNAKYSLSQIVDAVAADILAADPQGPLVQLPQHHPCAGDLTGDGQTDAAGAGAQIQHPALRQGPQPRYHVVHQRLRVRTGDQHAFGDVQRQPVELPLPDEVGHRLPCQMAAHQILRPLLDGRRDIQLPILHQLTAGLAGGEAHQLTGLQRSGLDACPAESLPDIHIQIVVSSRHNTLRCHILSFSGENGREFLTSGPCPSPPAAPDT